MWETIPYSQNILGMSLTCECEVQNLLIGYWQNSTNELNLGMQEKVNNLMNFC